MKMIAIIKPALLVLIFGAGTAAAEAGEWRLNPAACPDLVEDHIDSRVTTSRRDLREDVRDLRKVVCPASAWTYVSANGVGKSQRRVYSGPTVIYAGRTGYYHAPTRRNAAPALINIFIK